MRKSFSKIFICGLMIFSLLLCTSSCGDTSEDDAYTLPEDRTYEAVIELEDLGTIRVALYPEEAPITCANFVKLAKAGFYDGLTFHRVISGVMLQGGDPKGDGTGNSSTKIKGEFSENGVDNSLSHTRGTISMARANNYDSASCQFFLMQGDYTAWDGLYAAFGEITEGLEVLDAAVDACKDYADSNGLVSSSHQPVITSVTIESTPIA